MRERVAYHVSTVSSFLLGSDFHVPDSNVDSLKSKSISHSLLKAERDSSSAMDAEDDDEDREEFVHDDWEDRVDSAEHDAEPCHEHRVNSNAHTTKTSTRKNDYLNEGRTYPQDLWFLVGNYIAPESIQTFGLLCRGSWTVLKTFQFWSTLYERTYKQCERSNPSESFGDHLQVRLINTNSCN